MEEKRDKAAQAGLGLGRRQQRDITQREENTVQQAVQRGKNIQEHKHTKPSASVNLHQSHKTQASKPENTAQKTKKSA